MAPKETKKDRERRLKKAEELRGAEATDAATDAPTDGPTDDDEPDEELLYNAEGGLMRPGTSAAAATLAAAATINAVASAKVGASPTFSTDSSDVEGVTQEKGSARARTGTMGTKAKRTVSTRSSRSPGRAAKLPRRQRSRKRRVGATARESLLLLPLLTTGAGAGVVPPSTAGSTSASSSGESNWEEFYDDATVVKVRELLKTAAPRAPRNVSKGRFSFEASGEVLYVRKATRGRRTSG
jgi:hypothetical protein